MALDRALLERFRFDTTALTEDAELHLRLVRAGHRVAFRADASVRSDMPTGRKAMRSQQARWEGGRAAMFRRHAMPLLGGGLRERDGVRLAAIVELLIPPTAMLTLGHAVALLASIRAPRETRRAAAAASLMHVGFVLGGLASVRTPASTYRALLASPRLIFEKVLLLGGFAARGAPTSWGRTQREPHR
jgi:hypothetical protein